VSGEPTESEDVCESVLFGMFLEVVSLPHDALSAFFICLVDSRTVDFPDALADEHELRVPLAWTRKPGSRHANAQRLLDAVLFFLPLWRQRAISRTAHACCLPDSALLICRRLLSYLSGARSFVSELWGLGEDSGRWEDEWQNNIRSFLIEHRRVRYYGKLYYQAVLEERELEAAKYREWRATQNFGWPDEDEYADHSDHLPATLRHLNNTLNDDLHSDDEDSCDDNDGDCNGNGDDDYYDDYIDDHDYDDYGDDDDPLA
jgi:hypothetical protein